MFLEQAKAEGIAVRDLKFHKAEIITTPKIESESSTTQKTPPKQENEPEARGRTLRTRKDSTSSAAKPVKKGKTPAKGKKGGEEEKKESSDENEDDEGDDGGGKLKKGKKKLDETLDEALSDGELSSIMTPLDLLIEAAIESNPKQYELPKELTTSIPFPGSDKGRF